jgi:hypothetical protein
MYGWEPSNRDHVPTCHIEFNISTFKQSFPNEAGICLKALQTLRMLYCNLPKTCNAEDQVIAPIGNRPARNRRKTWGIFGGLKKQVRVQQ